VKNKQIRLPVFLKKEFARFIFFFFFETWRLKNVEFFEVSTTYPQRFKS